MPNFIIDKTTLNGAYVVTPRVFKDNRGYFLEVFNNKDFLDIFESCDFVQDNQSYSVEGVIRGLHLQKYHKQAKFVYVVDGEIFDVIVDLRKKSSTFGKWYGTYISSENKKGIYVPEGFAHGFLVISDYAKVIYKVTNYYYPDDEIGLIWNDPDLKIKWPKINNIILSEKDKNNMLFKDFVGLNL